MKQTLPADRFEVISVAPGPHVVEAVYRASPHIAVLDRIDGRTEAAQLELALLRRCRPDVRVIAVSGRSSPKDASIVEQGVFYYLAGRSRRALVRLIAAAAEAAMNREDKAPRLK